MLHQGRMELEGAKKTVEGVLDDVKAIKGIWQWLLGLFSKKPTQNNAPKPIAKAKVAAKQQSYEQLELKLISDIGENLGILFDTQQQITNYYRELEEESKTNFNPEQNNSKKAIERALIELQMEKLMEQVREAMVYAPAELKDLYTRFLRMYGKIEQEQEFARQQLIMQARYKRAREWRYHNLKVELGMWGLGLAIVWATVVWMMIQIALLSGQSLEWFSLESFVSFVSQLRR